jgi:hypothetical protein
MMSSPAAPLSRTDSQTDRTMMIGTCIIASRNLRASCAVVLRNIPTTPRSRCANPLCSFLSLVSSKPIDTQYGCVTA